MLLVPAKRQVKGVGLLYSLPVAPKKSGLPLAGWLWLPQAARDPTLKIANRLGQTPNPRSRGLLLLDSLPRESGQRAPISRVSRLDHFFDY